MFFLCTWEAGTFIASGVMSDEMKWIKNNHRLLWPVVVVLLGEMLGYFSVKDLLGRLGVGGTSTGWSLIFFCRYSMAAFN